MNTLVDTPAVRAALVKGDQKYDSAEYMLNRKLDVELQKAQLKQVFEKFPKTAEEFMMKKIGRASCRERVCQYV